MVKIRIFTVTYLLALVSVSSLAAETITVSVKRPSLYGLLASMEIYINGTSLGFIGAGSRNTWTFSGAKLGRNELSVLVHPLGDKSKEESRRSIAKSYFLVRRSGETIELSVGCKANDDYSLRAVVLSVSNEVGPLEIKSIKLDKVLKAVTLKESPPIRLAIGTEKTVEDTRRIKHEVKISNSWKVEANLKASIDGIWASAAMEIQGKIESATEKNYSVETEYKRSVTLRGGFQAVKIIWVEYYRTGTATAVLNGRELKIPFEFREDFDLLTRDSH